LFIQQDGDEVGIGIQGKQYIADFYATDFNTAGAINTRIHTETVAAFDGILLSVDHTGSSASLGAKTSEFALFESNRTSTRTSGTTADDFENINVLRTSVQNGAGGTFTSTGALISGTNVVTETAGTMTDSSFIYEAVQDADSLGGAFSMNSFIESSEIAAPALPAADFGRLYVADDGAGNTVLNFADSEMEHELMYAQEHFGEMYIADNAVATVITDDEEWQALTLAIEGETESFTFTAGIDGVVASIADAGGGDITVGDVAHGLTAGDYITMNGHTDPAYDGIFEVQTAATDTFTITAVYTATDTGFWQRGDSLTVVHAGRYRGNWHSTGIAATNGHVFDFAPIVNTTVSAKAKARRTFSNTDYGSFSGGGIIDLAVGDRIQFAAQNIGNSGDITIRTLDLALQRI